MNLLNSIRKSKLFTLIELIVVIVVLGILAAIVVPNISSFKEEADQKAIVSNVRNIQTAVDMYGLKNHQSTPTAESPALGNPQPIDLPALKPDYLRDVPKVKGVKYWLDYNNTVWASSIDAPTKVNYVEGKLSWETVDGATLYKVYKAQNQSLTSSSKNPKGLKYIKEFTPTNKENPSLEMTPLDKEIYLVSAIDEYGFETPAVTSDYKGYDSFVGEQSPEEQSSDSEASKLGTELFNPTEGWQRLDSLNPYFKYAGNWINDSNASNHAGTGKYTSDKYANMKFQFKGTKLRIISFAGSNRPSSVNITIDGKIETYDPTSWTGKQMVVYEKTGLSEGIHTVEMNAPLLSSGFYWDIDAIDIDSDGQLIQILQIGDRLPQPQLGWKRYDEDYPAIVFSSGWGWSGTGGNAYNGDSKANSQLGATVSFNFTGTKLRIINRSTANQSADISVIIDGVEQRVSLRGANDNQILVYEKTGLTNTLHTVVVRNNLSGYSNWFEWDAIDIDSNGEIVANKPIVWHGLDPRVFSSEPNTPQYNIKSTEYVTWEGNLSGKTITISGDGHHVGATTNYPLKVNLLNSQNQVVGTYQITHYNQPVNFIMPSNAVKMEFTPYSTQYYGCIFKITVS